MRALFLAVTVLLFAACASAPATGEERRQLVLEYVGHEVGTVGPFAKNALRELDVLSEKDRREAAALIEHGAVGFLVIEPNPSLPNRIVVVSGKRIIGDFPAPKKGA